MFTLDSIQIKKNLGIKFSWNKKVRFDKKIVFTVEQELLTFYKYTNP